MNEWFRRIFDCNFLQFLFRFNSINKVLPNGNRCTIKTMVLLLYFMKYVFANIWNHFPLPIFKDGFDPKLFNFGSKLSVSWCPWEGLANTTLTEDAELYWELFCMLQRFNFVTYRILSAVLLFWSVWNKQGRHWFTVSSKYRFGIDWLTLAGSSQG